MDNQPSGVDLVGAARIARRYAGLVVLCTLLAAAAAFAVSAVQRSQYIATAQVLFRNDQLDQQAAGLPVINNTNPQAEADTNLKLASLPKVAAQTAAVLGAPFRREDVADAVSVAQVGDTNLASVSATWTSPQVAARLANTYANEIVAARDRADAAYYANALRSVQLQLKTLTPGQQNSVQAADLKARAASLQTLAQLQSANVQVQQAAVAPTAPSAPKVARNTVIGGVLGLLLGAGIAFLLHRLDRRVREPRELEEIFGVPLIGVIPESTALKRSRAGDARQPLPHREAEVFGLLRAHIRYFNVDRQLRLIVVVSAASGEGKTTVARNLALISAMAGARVLLVEADLRRPTVAQQLGVKPRPGLAEVLVGLDRLSGSIQHADFGCGDESRSTVDVLVAGGMLPPNPAQVIESSAMKALLEEARQAYDLVVVDTPPLVLVPDAFPLLKQADAVLVVSRLSRIRKDIATRLRDALRGADAPVVGVVANGVGRAQQTVYGYDGGYGARVASKPETPAATASEDVTGDAVLRELPPTDRVDVPEEPPVVHRDRVVEDPPVVEGNGGVEHPPTVNGHDVVAAPLIVNGHDALGEPPVTNGHGGLEEPTVTNGHGVLEEPAVMNGHDAFHQESRIHLYGLMPPHYVEEAERSNIQESVRTNGHETVPWPATSGYGDALPTPAPVPAPGPIGSTDDSDASGRQADEGGSGSIPPPGWSSHELPGVTAASRAARRSSRLARVLGRRM